MGYLRLEIPFKFCGKTYSYTDDLYRVFLEKWDFAAAALKRGALSEYFKKLADKDESHRHTWEWYYKVTRNLQEDMWSDDYHEDVVFGKFMYYLSCKNGQEKLPPMPMDDADVSKSKVKFQRAEAPPPEREGCGYYGAFGSKTGSYKYREDAYIEYMTEEAWKANLSRMEWYLDDRDIRKVDETAGQKPKKVTALDNLVTLDRAQWWQDYLIELGKFEW